MDKISNKNSALIQKILIVLICVFFVGGFSYVAAKLIQGQGNENVKGEFLGDDSSFDAGDGSVETTLTITGANSVEVGKTITLNTTITPAPTSQLSITWTSLDKSVATVDSTGLVTGIKAGTVTITATAIGSDISEYYVDSFQITVKDVYSITCPSSIYVGENGSCSISGGSITGAVTSSSSSIATVESTAATVFNIKGKSAGTATFTAIINGQSITSNTVSVLENTIPVSSVSVNCNSSSIVVGDNTSCSVTILPTNATSKNVVWSSSDSLVASIDQSGYVTARAKGTVKIIASSASDFSKNDEFTITVSENTIDSINGEKIIAIAADVGSVSGLYGAKNSDKEYITVDWGASGAGAKFNGCIGTTSCQITFYHQGAISSVQTTPAKVTAKIGGITKEYEVTVYSYCAWKLVDSNMGPYTEADYTSMSGKFGTRDSMKYVEGCYAYEGWHKESDGWYYVNHYNRCCGGGGSVPPVESEACYIKRGEGTDNTYCFGTSSTCSGFNEKTEGKDTTSCDETQACYQTSNGEYVTGKFSGQNGYTYIGTSCPVTPPVEEPACYKDKDDNYIWGKYQNDNNYTLVSNVLSEEDCHEKIDVPMTSSNIKNIIYVFVVILLSFGIYIIYYSYLRRNFNK